MVSSVSRDTAVFSKGSRSGMDSETGIVIIGAFNDTKGLKSIGLGLTTVL